MQHFDKRMTKVKFERVLVSHFGKEDLVSSPYTEHHGDTISKMTLYYLAGVHIGTWMMGRGWTFESAYKTAPA